MNETELRIWFDNQELPKELKITACEKTFDLPYAVSCCFHILENKPPESGQYKANYDALIRIKKALEDLTETQ